MNLTIISLLRIALTVAPPAARLCKGDEPDRSPRPFDVVPIYALHRSARR